MTREEILTFTENRTSTQSRARGSEVNPLTHRAHCLATMGYRTNNTTQGLPLFAWHPPCQVIAFPADKQVNRVRQTARVIASDRSFTSACKTWTRTLSRMCSAMRTSGFGKEVIDQEIKAFEAAVDLALAEIDAPWRIRRANGVQQ